MPYATRDGVSLYYEYDGEGDRETVAFVPGLGVGRWQWDWQREAIGEQYDVLVADNRGAGNSEAALPPVIPRLPACWVSCFSRSSPATPSRGWRRTWRRCWSTPASVASTWSAPAWAG